MSWNRFTLGEISTNIQTGPFGSQLHQSDYSETGIPVVMPKDLIDGHISEETIARVNEEHVDRLSRHKIDNGDILYSRRGDVGRCAYAAENEKGWLCGTGCLRVTINPAIAIPKFVFYQLQKNETVGWVVNHAVGSTMLNLNTSILSEVPVELPPLIIQNRIVEILSAYEDLIENNRKQIKLLEEAAQRLYKEWFVDLRFPGYEDVQIVDGVPEGWKKVSVNDCLELHMNGGWGKESPTGKNTHLGRVIRGTDINDIKAGMYKGVPLRYHNDNDILKRVLHKGDIVFELSNGNIDSIGRSLLIDELILQNCGENTICASFCKMLRPKDKIRGLVLYWEIQDMQSDGRMKPFKKQGANGINNFAFEDFLEHQLLVPRTNALLLPLENIMKEMSTIQRRFALLIEARDRLLPKLMSGEIEI